MWLAYRFHPAGGKPPSVFADKHYSYIPAHIQLAMKSYTATEDAGTTCSQLIQACTNSTEPAFKQRILDDLQLRQNTLTFAR